MRLSTAEIDAIKKNILNVDSDAVIYIFGSRTDDSRRGGDIDIMVEASKDISLEERLKLEDKISSDCDDIKVDMLFVLPNSQEKTIHSIARNGIKL